MSKQWEVMPGYGEVILETIRNDVTLWQLNRIHSDAILQKAELWHKTSQADIQGVIEKAVVDGTLDAVQSAAKSMDQRQKDHIVWAALNSAAAARLELLKKGRLSGTPGKEAQVTVERPGVVLERFIGTLVDDLNWRLRNKEAIPGQIFRGHIDELSSAPSEGGKLKLELWTGGVTLRGLVDPVTAQPRVRLEILGKRSR